MSAFTIWQIKHEQSTRQQFLLLYTYMNQLQQTLNSLEASVQEFLDGLVDTERVFRQLKENSSIGNLTNPRNTIEAAGIEFESVKAGSLKSLTFRCPEKTITAILGLPDRETPTLGHLLIRIAEAQNGIVRIGGVDVREYSVGLLRHNIGFIPRKCRLLGETIMQSLKYGLRNSENIERAAMEAACQTVNIHDTIMKIPGNYNAPMGHKGGGLKGKERRRLALARLLLQNPRILVVDGAITAIKGETDARLQDLLKAVFHQRTVLLLE
jgi:ABC-type multidrug transport system fused ATPase/permease subunit